MELARAVDVLDEVQARTIPAAAAEAVNAMHFQVSQDTRQRLVRRLKGSRVRLTPS